MTDQGDHEPAIARVPTHIPGLDTVLQGGLFQGGLYILRGAPGTGKTILSSNITFNHIDAGGRAVYITLLAETNSRLFGYLSSLTFFRREPIGDTLLYLSASQPAERQALDGLHELVRRAIIDHKASLLVIDGLVTVEALTQQQLDLKHFVRNLQVYLDTNGCVGILLQEESGHVTPFDTVVDGIIEIYDRRADFSAYRELSVQKFRGSDYLRGGHEFKIGDEGIIVYPRLEALSRKSLEPIPEVGGKLNTGIERLDVIMEGGIPASSITLLLGTAGAGKTLLGLHFLAAGAAQGEPSLYVGLHERPADLITQAQGIGIPLSQLVAQGQLELLWFPLYESSLDQIGQTLLDTVEQRGIRRLFFDGTESLAHALGQDGRLGTFLTALRNTLRMHEVTTLFSYEMRMLVGPLLEFPIPGLSPVADNIIFLRIGEIESRLYRLISVLKMRKSNYDPAIREVVIGASGLNIAEPFSRAETLLTGQGSAQPGRPHQIQRNQQQESSAGHEDDSDR